VEEASPFTLFGTVVTGEQIGVTDTQSTTALPVALPAEESRNRLALPLI
jgi:hypothetical protein